MSETPLLDISGIAKSFGSVVALRDAALNVRAGEVHALMGANGAGKSTARQNSHRRLSPRRRRDRSRRRGKEFSALRRRRARLGSFSVYQDPALVPDLTVAQNLRLARVSRGEVLRWLAELGIDRLDLDAFIRDLPYPVLRLIDLARALASEPKLLLLDEITAALSADLAEKVFAMVRRRRERAIPSFSSPTAWPRVASLCDRATVLRDGRRGRRDRYGAWQRGADRPR